ncbi:MAG: DUF445 domain-containing protein [Burkholderiales bacterium]|nr:DUF445 domain-containing protein [Burkholderiales bacterium]
MPGDTEAADAARRLRETRQRQRLTTMRWAATGLLVLMTGLFALAHAHLGSHPAWGYVRAFAEAAMVGAMADWFAVVALFRRPLGLPIWHTAIVPNKKDEIARSLGEFVESHFVTVDTIVARIRSFDTATRLSEWLVKPHNADKLGKLLTAATRQILASVDDKQIRAMLRTAITKRLQAVDLAGPVAGFGLDLMAEKRHHAWLDWALQATHEWLDSEGADATLGAAIDSVLDNRLLALLKGTATTRIRNGLKNLIDAAAKDPQHPLRLRFDDHIAHWLLQLETDPELGQHLRNFQAITLENPRLQAAFEGLWDELRTWLSDDLAHQNPALGRHAARIATEWGAGLTADAATRAWINDAMEAAAIPLIIDNRGKVAAFIQAQIDDWSKEEMTDRLELAVGRDLQFIRINGTLVGGLVGLILHLLVSATQRL